MGLSLLSNLHRRGYTFSFHDNEEIGTSMLSRIGKETRLKLKICAYRENVTPIPVV
jgi:hypothetical protein